MFCNVRGGAGDSDNGLPGWWRWRHLGALLPDMMPLPPPFSAGGQGNFLHRRLRTGQQGWQHRRSGRSLWHPYCVRGECAQTWFLAVGGGCQAQWPAQCCGQGVWQEIIKLQPSDIHDPSSRLAACLPGCTFLEMNPTLLLLHTAASRRPSDSPCFRTYLH